MDLEFWNPDSDSDANDLEKTNTEGTVISLDKHNAILLVAVGGKGGQGNKAASGQRAMSRHSMPTAKIPGGPGQQRSLLLELKLIADVGLVGFPNAGKSSLLAALSNAHPKIAPYPFTTLTPSVGIVEYSDLERLSVADIPGLIEGASEDRGLGHEFLRHIERTKMLLFVLDGAGSEGREPRDDLRTLVSELRLYGHGLLDKPSLVFANKCDLQARTGTERRLRLAVRELGLELVTGSAMAGEGLGLLADRLREILRRPSQTNDITDATRKPNN